MKIVGVTGFDQNCGSFRIKFLTKMYWSRQYLSIDEKKKDIARIHVSKNLKKKWSSAIFGFEFCFLRSHLNTSGLH